LARPLAILRLVSFCEKKLNSRRTTSYCLAYGLR
jgi:hypothetical protein